jgi:electron transport complex protein RnfA
MSSLLLIILSAMLVSMVAIAGTSGWRPFLHTADVYGNAAGVAQASLIAVPVITGLTWLLSYAVLYPLELNYLRTPVFVAVVLTIVPCVEVVLGRAGRLVPSRPAFTVLLSANSLALGVALMGETRASTFVRALLFAVGSAIVFGILLLSAATLYERLRYADIPAPFREAPLALITAGLMALALMGFAGLIQE